MHKKYTLKFDYDLKDFFEKYLQKIPDIEFSNVAEFLKNHIFSLKNDLEEDLYNLKNNKEVIEFFKNYVKSNPDLGYIEGDEFIRDIIRKKMEELRKI